MTSLHRIFLIAAAVLLVVSASAARADEQAQLLATNGTLYVVRAGTAKELGIAGNYARPDDNLIEWSYLRQDGSRGTGLIPGTSGSTLKHNLDLAYDETSGAFLVLWKEEVSLLNILHLGILRGDQWTISDLLPNTGFPHAFNPRMLLSHPVAHSLDGDGKDVWTTSSVVSVLWWEDNSSISQARYAPIFLDDSSASDVQVYDLPATTGGGGPTPPTTGIPAGAYMYPSLQLEGPGGGILASFTDLAAGLHRVVRISFPSDLGKPGPGNPTWLRRRIPVVDGVGGEPIPRMAPGDGSIGIRTFIGTGYRPTLVWRDTSAVHFIRFDGQKWSDINSIALGKDMTYDQALSLIQDMATKN